MHVLGKFLVTLSRGYEDLCLSFHDVHMMMNMDINREVPTFAHEYFPTYILLTFSINICSVSENILAFF